MTVMALKRTNFIGITDILLAIVLGLALGLIVNFKVIQNFVANDTGADPVEAAKSLDYAVDGFLGGIDQLSATPIVVTILFWMAIGAVVYKLVTMLAGIFSELIQDLDISFRFKHPKQFTLRTFWVSVALKFLFTFIVGFVFIGWIVLGVNVLFPFSSATLQLSFIAESIVDVILLASASTLVLMLFCFGLIILARLLFSLQLSFESN